MKIGDRLKKASKFALDILFPPFCVNCGKEGMYICKECSLFVLEASLVCPVCFKQSYKGEVHEGCKNNSLDGLISIFEYNGLVKELIKEVKENHLSHALYELTDRAIISVLEDKERFSSFLSLILDKETRITYVPMVKKKESGRGFNQAKIIAEELGKKTGCRVIDSIRIVEELNNREYINIVLVDDFLLTGETLKRYSRVLRGRGVRSIWGFTLARAC